MVRAEVAWAGNSDEQFLAVGFAGGYRQQAETLEDAHRLNFPAFARRLQRNCSIEGWR